MFLPQDEHLSGSAAGMGAGQRNSGLCCEPGEGWIHENTFIPDSGVLDAEMSL